MLGLKLTASGEEVLLHLPDNNIFRASYLPEEGDGTGTVTETAEILILDFTAGRSLKNRANRLFADARRFAESGTGRQVYVEFRLSEDEDWWRSEILNGAASLTDGALGSRMGANLLLLAMSWERRGYWEALEETERPLSNSNGTEVLGGLPLWNHDDGTATIQAGQWTGWGVMTYPVSMSVGGGHDNWATIHTDDLAGDLPAPARVVLSHDVAGTVVDTVYLGLDGNSSPARYVLEAEDATAASAATEYSTSTTASANASDGDYRTVTWTESTERELFSWGLNSALLEAAAARSFRAILRFFSDGTTLTPVYTNLDLRLVITPSGQSNVLWQSPLKRVVPSRALQELTTLRLPPFPRHTGSYRGLTLRLYGKRTGGGTLHIDDLLFLATDGFRKLTPLANGWGVGEPLVIDEERGFAYLDEPSFGQSHLHEMRGRPLLLKPGTSAGQRLQLLIDYATATGLGLNAGDSGIGHISTAQVWARARRSSL